MSITETRRPELCDLRLPSGPLVAVLYDDGRFFTEQQFDDGNAATIELPSALDAFLCYEYAREHGRIRAPFPVPVADEEPDPPDESAPVLMVAAEARGIRRRAHVTIRALAAEVSVSVSTIKEWEGKDCVLPLGAKRRARSAKYQRYVAALAELAVAYPPAEPEPQVVASAPDGKRRREAPARRWSLPLARRHRATQVLALSVAEVGSR